MTTALLERFVPISGDIGEPQRIIEIEPIPQTEPIQEPSPAVEPVKVPSEEPVPA